MRSTEGLRDLLYGRVSQVRGETTSVPSQLARMRDHAEHDGRRIVGEYADEEPASQYSNRPRESWAKVMEIIAAKGTDVLSVWELSRATRDRPVYAALIAACTDAEVLVCVDGRLYDPADPDDAYALDMGNARSVHEVGLIRKRVLLAVGRRAKEGKPHAQLPYGYRRVINPDTGRVTGYEIHPEQGPIVQEIVRRLLGGDAAHAIAADLNRRGVPTAGTGRCAKDCGCRERNGRPDPRWEGEHTTVSGKWLGTNISKVALRGSYAGIRVRRNTPIPGVETRWPPLITPDDRARLVAMFGGGERKKWRRDTHVRHLGTGIFRCGREGCDGRMRVVANPAGPNYDCRKCHKVARRQALVDEWVKWMMIERLSLPDVLAILAGTDDEKRKEAKAEADRLRAEEIEAQQMLDRDEITLADMAVFRKKWKPRMAAAEAAAQPPESFAAVAEMAGPDAEADWDAASIGLRREVVDKLAVVTILPTGRRGGTPQPFDPDLVRIEWKGSS